MTKTKAATGTTKKLTLNKETLRYVGLKTGIKTGPLPGLSVNCSGGGDLCYGTKSCATCDPLGNCM